MNLLTNEQTATGGCRYTLRLMIDSERFDLLMPSTISNPGDAIENARKLSNALFDAKTKAFEVKVIDTQAETSAESMDECIFHYRVKTVRKYAQPPKLQLVA